MIYKIELEVKTDQDIFPKMDALLQRVMMAAYSQAQHGGKNPDVAAKLKTIVFEDKAA